MATFKSTDQRLAEACCSVHQAGYESTCINCRTRYFDNLIEDSYVSISRLEQIETDLRYQTARANSLEVERDSLRVEVVRLRALNAKTAASI